MLKNVATVLIVYVWDAATGLPSTGVAGTLTAYRSLDFGTVTVLGDTTATELDATNAKGYYKFDLTAAETNGDYNLYTCKSSTAGLVALAVPPFVHTVPDLVGSGVVGSGSTTTSIVTSALSPAAAVTDQFKGRIVIFNKDTTTANLRGQATDITASTSGGVLTVSALSTAAVSGDTFVIQ